MVVLLSLSHNDLSSSLLSPLVSSISVCGSLHRQKNNAVSGDRVWGPLLWNAFFGDSAFGLRQLGFCVVVYADDYNAFQIYPRCAHNRLIMSELREFQRELHKWGRGNQVKFDAGKESFLILSRENSLGDPIKLLGVKFDGQLRMTNAIRECVDESSWRLRTLMRTQRYHTDAELLLLFKSHILSYLEYRTPAIYHACSTALCPVCVIVAVKFGKWLHGRPLLFRCVWCL